MRIGRLICGRLSQDEPQLFFSHFLNNIKKKIVNFASSSCSEMEKTIDIDKILQSKMGDKSIRVSRFLVRWLKHIVHEDEVNDFLWRTRD